MATTRLSDIIDVVVYQDLPQISGPEKTAFFESGLIARNALLDSLASAAGKTAELPYWNDLDGSIEVNYSNDNPATLATPQKLAQGEQIARKAFVNQGWQAADLASELAMGGTAMEAIRAKTSRYFARQWQRRLIAAVNGVMADNVANDAGDMVHDVAAEAVASQTADTRFNQDAFIEAAYTMGDAVEGVTAIAVHSTIAKQITKLNGAEDVRDSEGNLLYQAYLGRRIIVDDGLPVVAGTTDGFKYVSVLFGPGVFGYGVGSPEVPVEVEREAAQGNGGGIETLWERNTWLLHPFGFQQLGTPAGLSFTQAELATAAVWDRVLPRKLVPLAFMVTN
ncbi:MAG TPA: major capsid protein [Modicisalibacter sp.]|nr:major capsid protein [Modicisalibacter sp.]